MGRESNKHLGLVTAGGNSKLKAVLQTDFVADRDLLTTQKNSCFVAKKHSNAKNIVFKKLSFFCRASRRR
jgi:hypothetical protein